MAFQDDLRRADAAVAAGQNFVYEGKTYTPAQIVKQLTGPNGILTLRARDEQQAIEAQARMQKQESNLAKRQEKATNQALKRAKEKLAQLERNKNIFLQDFRSGKITNVEYNARFALVDQLTEDIAAMEAGTPAVAVGGTSDPFAYRLLTPQETGTLAAQRTDIEGRTSFATPGQVIVSPTPMVGTGFTEEQISTMRANAAKFGPQLSMISKTDQPPSNITGDTVSDATGRITVKKADVDAALAASGLPDTPANRKQIRADLKAGKQPIGDWLTLFKQKFPQYQYLLDEQTFGPDMTALLQRAITEKWYDSDQFETLMAQGFAGTQYAQNTTTSQQNFDKLTPANKQAQIDQFKLSVQQTFGNLQFDDATLTNIATKAARDNKQGKALELYVYQQSFAKPVGTTEFAQPTAAARALTSSAADEIRQIGRDYGSRVSDQEIQDVLTGKTTIDSLRQTYKMAAKRWYRGASDDIDAGVTVEQLFRPYKQYAAAILGKPMEQIDLIDANGAPTIYASALEGADGPMSISEWSRKLKSDDRFGWQFTDEAKQKATNLVMDLEKAFGFRR